LSNNENIIEDNITTEYNTINENETLGRALALFKNSADVLVVVDKKNDYTGILHERSILRTDLDPGKSKVKSFKTRAPKIKAATELKECARLMIENNIYYLPYFKNDKISGLISYTNILKSPVLQKLSRRTIRDIMIHSIPVTSPKEKIGIIYKKFKNSDIFSIPVLENEKFLGIVNLHDTVHTILQHKEKPDFGTKLGEKEHLLDLPVRNIINSTAPSLLEGAVIGDVIKIMIDKELDCVSIVDNNNFLQEIITIKDLLRFVAYQDENVILPRIQINSNLEELNRSRVEATVNEFVKKFSSILSESEFEIYMREHREKQKHQKLIYTRIHAHAHHDNFDATAEAFGEDHSLRDALEKLEKQVRRKKSYKKHGGK
jgi:predicted transcriptional regulator/ribosome-associated translation inhibitor RaiA